MRTDQEILDLIIEFAQNDANIRAVVMNGSRVNPKIEPDIMQDFDVVYFVKDVTPLWHHMGLPGHFGELSILQLPEEMEDPPASDDGHYTYLMQFRDGHRIDLSIYPLEKLAQAGEDSLTVVLLDKDGLAPELPLPNENSYLSTPPTAKEFANCCNEFWWLMPYVAKGLWRGELVNPRYFLDDLMRGELHKMLNWYYGVKAGYEHAPGKLGKRWQAVFSPEMWQMLEATYADHTPASTSQALSTMGDLFRQAAQSVANYHGYKYLQRDDDHVNLLVRRIQATPKGAPFLYEEK
jgi:aminoglycoside 6-adenylyltransferase